MLRSGLRLIAIAGALLCASAEAHDDGWISKGNLRNTKSELCCGMHDCKVEHDAVVRSWGWSIEGEGSAHEDVPYSEAMPTQDGQLWICRRPNGTRRCTFGLLPGL